MTLLIYITAIAALGLSSLFAYQFFRLRSGKVERLPNITVEEIIRPAMHFAEHWFFLAHKRFEAFSYPILMLFYRALLRFLHTLTSRIAHRFNQLANTIKGKGVHAVNVGTVSAHWQEYRKLE